MNMPVTVMSMSKRLNMWTLDNSVQFKGSEFLWDELKPPLKFLVPYILLEVEATNERLLGQSLSFEPICTQNHLLPSLSMKTYTGWTGFLMLTFTCGISKISKDWSDTFHSMYVVSFSVIQIWSQFHFFSKNVLFALRVHMWKPYKWVWGPVNAIVVFLSTQVIFLCLPALCCPLIWIVLGHIPCRII